MVENKNFSQNFVIAFEKMCFWPGSGLGKIPGSGSVKKRIRIRNTELLNLITDGAI